MTAAPESGAFHQGVRHLDDRIRMNRLELRAPGADSLLVLQDQEQDQDQDQEQEQDGQEGPPQAGPEEEDGE